MNELLKKQIKIVSLKQKIDDCDSQFKDLIKYLKNAEYALEEAETKYDEVILDMNSVIEERSNLEKQLKEL